MTNTNSFWAVGPINCILLMKLGPKHVLCVVLFFVFFQLSESNAKQSKLRLPMISLFVCFPKPIAGFSLELTVNTWNFPSLSLVPCSSGHGFRFRRRLKREKRILMCSGSTLLSCVSPLWFYFGGFFSCLLDCD